MTEATEAPEVVAGSEEYNAQMAEKYQNQSEGETEVVETVPVEPMPEDGYEKFYNAETGEYDWQNHAKELAYRLEQSKKQDDKAEQKPEETEDNSETNTEDQEVKGILDAAGLDQAAVEAEVFAGELSENTYEALEKVGISRDLVDQYVTGIKAQADLKINSMLDYVGGQDKWDRLSTWAAENLEPNEVEQYNEMLNGENWKVAVDTLNTKMGLTLKGNEPMSQITGDENVVGSTYGYRSKSEMKQDMADPRYTSDPAFRQQVMRKMQSATWDLDQY